MDATMLDRIRTAVTTAGFTQAELSERLGITADKVSKSLAGVRKFTSTELATLAEVCRVTVEWIVLGDETARPKMAARVTQSALDAEASWVELADDLADAAATLKRLGYEHELPSLPPRPSTSSFVAHGQILARAALEALSAAGHTPWDDGLIQNIEDVFGVDVAIVSLPASCHGFTWQTDEFRLICVAATKNWARQRFTLAHELGHILSQDAHGALLGEVAGSDWSHYFTEKSANAFAGYFLMPPEEIRSAYARHANSEVIPTVDRLAWDFKVSPAALSARLEKLGLLTSDQRRVLSGLTMLDVASMLDVEDHFDVEAALSASPRPPRRIVQQLRAAVRAGQTSVRQLGRLHDMSPEEYLASSDQAPGLREVELMLTDDGGTSP